MGVGGSLRGVVESRTAAPERAETSAAPAWQALAGCRGFSVELFYPTREDPVLLRLAKSVCAACPVVTLCLEAGMKESEGIWGGMTPDERRSLRRARRARH
jgi:WhiB family redox-sensing transcriptional regulator